MYEVPQAGGGRRSARETAAAVRKRTGFWSWWLHLTAPDGADTYYAAPTHEERERLRRAGLTSAVAPFVFIAPLLLLQQAGDPGTTAAIVALMLVSPLSLVLNRRGYQVAASLLLVIAMDVVIEGTLVTAKGGLGAGWLLTFDLFIIPLVTVGVLLSRRYLWVFATLHIVFILCDYYLLPHAADLVALVDLWHGAAIAYARPVIIQIGGGLLSFIEVRSTDEAIRRADQAEELAALEHSVAVQRQQLELGVQQILETHVRIANGDYSARAPMTQDSLLWQIAGSLNNLMGRLQKSGQAEHQLRRTEEELRRLAGAIDEAAAGKHAIWPAPSGTAADLIIERVTGRGRVAVAASLPFSQQQQRQPLPPGHVSGMPMDPQRQGGMPGMPGMPGMQGNTGVLRAPGTGPLDPSNLPAWPHSGPLPGSMPYPQPTPNSRPQSQQNPQNPPLNPWFGPPEG